MEQSFIHHYVPVWYQKRFMEKDQTSYCRLDLDPEIIKTPTGKIVRKSELNEKGPKKFFYENELYTTNYMGNKNDDIEKFLFGKIDTQGSLALPALVSKDWMRELHPHFINFFEFMDAQKLRTPKGLCWLKKVVGHEDKNNLLYHMQKIRRMNCTMWAEAAMEIVSAEDSDIKFIVSDNPITSFNPECYPLSNFCKFPNDPLIEWQGTRTIFPVDMNHCVILTNLEYAQKPDKAKALKPRTNARYFDQTVARYDDIIRGRKLTKEEVLKINYILKRRAHKYIAAAQEAWLFPERELRKRDWKSFDKVLISNEFELIGRGGEIFLGGKGGKLLYTQDDFGRRPKNRQEWEAKVKQVEQMERQLREAMAKHRDKTNDDLEG